MRKIPWRVRISAYMTWLDSLEGPVAVIVTVGTLLAFLMVIAAAIAIFAVATELLGELAIWVFGALLLGILVWFVLWTVHQSVKHLFGEDDYNDKL